MGNLKTVTYVDDEGRKWATQIPDTEPDTRAPFGVPLGPPPLDFLELPLAIEVRLHNQLFERRLLTHADVKRRRPELQAALMAALRVDADRIMTAYSAPGGT